MTAVAALLATALLGAAAQAGHPRHNIAPKPAYAADCAHYRSSSVICIRHALAAINRARGLEHVKPMILPDNFARLSYSQQTFVVTDLERVDRGLPPFLGITGKLNRTARAAAAAHADPVPATSTVGRVVVLDYASNWSSNFGPLAADYGWMYDDGYGSYNVDCPAASAPGCWGHRDVILTRYSHPVLISGVGSVEQKGLVAIAQLFVAGKGTPPVFRYSWANALRHGADGHRAHS